MPLVFNKSLNGNSWLKLNKTPPRDDSYTDYEYFFNTITQNTFKRLTPEFNQVIFDRESKHDNIILMDDYVTCTSGLSGSHKAIGIKSLPLKENLFQLFTIKVKSVNSSSPMIGFCDKDKAFDNGKINHCILWNIHEPVIRYYYTNNIELSDKTFNTNKTIVPGDVLVIAVDNKNNLMWVSTNYKWVNSRPNKLDTGVEFIPKAININNPVLYIIPSGWTFELIKYEQFKPSYYSDAVSLPILDWYLVNKYDTKETV